MIKYNNINKFLNRIKNLIIDPKNEWIKIDKESMSRKKTFKEFVLPFALICSILVFAGQILEEDIITSFKYFSVNLITIFAGIYCSLLILKEITTSNKAICDTDCDKMIIYASAIFFLFHSVAHFFSEGSIIRSLLILGQFSCIIPIWNGIGTIIKIDRANKTVYTIIITVLITLLPSIFEQLFSILFNIQIASI